VFTVHLLTIYHSLPFCSLSRLRRQINITAFVLFRPCQTTDIRLFKPYHQQILQQCPTQLVPSVVPPSRVESLAVHAALYVPVLRFFML